MGPTNTVIGVNFRQQLISLHMFMTRTNKKVEQKNLDVVKYFLEGEISPVS